MKIKTKRGARRIRNQRVINRRFVVTDYEGCSYITAGKLYYIVNTESITAKIVHDKFRTITIVINGARGVLCAHLDEIGTWYHPIR